MQKIVFIGIHNKPGKSPFCSTTRTGKIVDEIIEKLKEIGKFSFEKTNLYPVDYMPEGEERKEMEANYKIRHETIYIGFGIDKVGKWMKERKLNRCCLTFHHPSIFALFCNNSPKAKEIYIGTITTFVAAQFNWLQMMRYEMKLDGLEKTVALFQEFIKELDLQDEWEQFKEDDADARLTN